MFASLHRPDLSATALWLLLFGAAQGEDVVVLKRSDGGLRTLRCEVLDYTGAQLRIRTQQGDELSYRGEQVRSVAAAVGPAHQTARQAMSERRWDDALGLIRQASAQERRVWVRRELLADMTRCHANLGNWIEAGSAFEFLCQSDPQTVFFDRIPLAWAPRALPADAQRKAAEWSAPDRLGAVRLMGASWLLTGPQGAQAADVLRALLNDADSRTAHLAAAQLWRTRAIVASEAEVGQWRERLRRLPPELRGGPDFIVGRALARLGQSEQAALLLMRAPIGQPGQVVLASESLLAAAAELEKLGRAAQAWTLYSELLRSYGDTTAAAAARSRLEQLPKESD